MPNFDWGKFLSTAAKDAAKTASETSGPAPGTGSVPNASATVVSKATPVDVGEAAPLVDVNPIDALRSKRRTSFFDRYGFGG
jgi:hypothetical protein